MLASFRFSGACTITFPDIGIPISMVIRSKQKLCSAIGGGWDGCILKYGKLEQFTLKQTKKAVLSIILHLFLAPPLLFPLPLPSPLPFALPFPLPSLPFPPLPFPLPFSPGIQHVAPLEDYPVHMWDKMVAINLTAPFHTTRLAIKEMKERGEHF